MANPRGISGFTSQRRLGAAKLREFSLIQKFEKGYRNREDITTLPPDVMVVGSQNVLTNVYQRIGIRKGYTLDGQRDTSRNPIVSAFDWERHTGNTLHLRSGYDAANAQGKLQFRYVASQDGERWDGHIFVKDQVYWIDLLTGLSENLFNYTDYWDAEATQSLMLFVNGTPQIYEWDGGVAVVKSTSNASGVLKTWKNPGEVQTVTLANGGQGYSAGDVLLINAYGQNAYVTVTSVNISGTITAFALSGGGSAYSVDNNLPAMGGNGNSALFNVTAIYSSAGTGYALNDTLTISTGGANATFKITDVLSSGAIKEITLTNPGSGYTTGVKATTTSGAGTGATLDITAVAQGYIEKYGTTSWAEEGFYLSELYPQRTININGNLYQYTGGESTTFLVGINTNPTGEPNKSVAFQSVISTPNQQLKDFPSTFANALIANLKNQIYVGSLTERSVYVSKVDNYKDFSFTSPVRLVGEGATLTLDGVPTSLIPQQAQMYISAGKNQWYETQFILSSDNQAEALNVQRLKTTGQQAAQSQGLTTKIKNVIAFVSYEKILNTLGTSKDFLNDPQVSDLSSPIVNDMNVYSFDGGFAYYFPGSVNLPGTYLLFSVPQKGIVRMYNMTNSQNTYWEAPLIMPITCFSIIDGELYGHSSQSSNTFELFNGYNDDGHSVVANVSFAFNNGGSRTLRKSATACYVEGYINPNTNITLSLQRDLDGAASSYSTVISGSDTQIVPESPDSASLGKSSLGKDSLGGEATFVSESATPPKFRVEKTYSRVEYFEEQVSFTSSGTDLRWEILAFGTNAAPAVNEPTDIRE